MSPYRGDSYDTDLYAGKSASAVTSNEAWIGEAEQVSVFVRGTGSETTIQLSNASGGHEAEDGPVTIPESSWARGTSAGSSAVPQMISVDTYARWLRTLRSETTEVRLSWRR